MNTNEMIAKLKTMATKAGESIYERVKMAATVLSDSAWVRDEFAGDDEKARDTVEADCFPELSVAFSLADLLILYREFPEIQAWRKVKFNLSRFWAEYEENRAKANERPRVTRERPKAADFKEATEKAKQLEWSLANVKSEAERKEKDLLTKLEVVREKSESEIERLRRENAELREENSQMRGEIKVLNRLIEQMRQERSPVLSR